MLERLLILAAIVVVVVAAVVAVRACASARRARLMAPTGVRAWDALGEVADGRPGVVQFSTRSCAACHASQAPAVARVAEQLGPGTLRVVHIDAARQPELAQAFGVMTVPSTVVLDAAGHVLAINQGFAPTARLLAQLQQTL